MGKTYSAVGVVLKGDFAGCYVWNWDGDNYYVVGDGVHPYNKDLPVKSQASYELGWGLLKEFVNLDSLNKFLEASKQYVLNSDVIDKIVDVDSKQNGPSADAFIRGTLFGGATLGAAAAMYSQTSSATLAVYTKDEKKMLIKFYSISSAQRFQHAFFVF